MNVEFCSCLYSLLVREYIVHYYSVKNLIMLQMHLFSKLFPVKMIEYQLLTYT